MKESFHMKYSTCLNYWELIDLLGAHGPPESQVDWQDSCNVTFFTHVFCERVYAPACPRACVHACHAEMRPVCLLLSQIAPMRAPKITTKSPGWVGWKSCQQPFLQSLLPYCISEWHLTHHRETVGRREVCVGGQSLVFDHNKFPAW